jgi:hypothetical protein
MAQGVECLRRKRKALTSNPITTKRKRRKEEIKPHPGKICGLSYCF